METYTFVSNKNGEHRFTVKVDFLKNCPNPENFSDFELFDNYNIFQFFHNTEGPAIVNLKDNTEEYFINGEWVNDEDRKKIIYNTNFKSDFDASLKAE